MRRSPSRISDALATKHSGMALAPSLECYHVHGREGHGCGGGPPSLPPGAEPEACIARILRESAAHDAKFSRPWGALLIDVLQSRPTPSAERFGNAGSGRRVDDQFRARRKPVDRTIG